MFGLKWLWKSNKTKIDTSNFVSREFLSTTLQDYVNRDLLNTTLSNELANYVSTTTLNTTLQNYVQTTTLNNYVSTNTTQSISGAKTFTEGVVINKNPVPLTLKATDNNKTYIVYKDSSNNSNFSLGANSGQTSFEVNRGDLLIQTQQNNKTVSFETGVIKTNRARVEFGTEINAGYGGGTVKFIPEDNSTKTLQFYNSAATDTRRFNLLVPEPSVANSPATKNYVDNKETAINNQITAINNRIVENNTILKNVYTFTPSSSTPRELGGVIYRYNLVIENFFQNVSVLGISVDFKDQSNAWQKAAFWENSYALGFNTINSTQYLGIQLTGNKALYDQSRQIGLILDINFTQFEITVFYMNNSNREVEQRYQGRIVPLGEIFGGN